LYDTNIILKKKKDMEKDSIWTGVILGMMVPAIGYLLAEALFGFLISTGVMSEAFGAGIARRDRLIALLAICFNLVPFHISKKNYWDKTMRGVVFPTLVYVAFWLYRFGSQLF
jgi:hypothetical protein